MLRVLTLFATALVLCTPAHAYNDPISRGLAEFLIFSASKRSRARSWSGARAMLRVRWLSQHVNVASTTF